MRLRSDDVCGVKIGPHIFRKGDRDSMAEMRGVIENRELFREAIEKDNLIVMNTHFTKQEHKLVTYKEDKSHPGGPPYDRSKYDTLDFILVPQRWRNSIRDVENDIDSGINSDHYPLIAKVHIRLRARIWAKKKTWVYHKCNDEQRKLLNQTLRKEAVRECNADYQSFACWALKAEMLLPKTEKHKNQPEISSEIENRIKEKRELAAMGRWEEAKHKGEQIKKNITKEKRQRLLKMISKDLDPRDQWMGLKMLRKGYNPLPISLRNEAGEKITLRNRANAAADFLATKIWGSTAPGYVVDERGDEQIIKHNLGIGTNDITMTELMGAIRKLKRGKTPGPDCVPLEVFKEMEEDQLNVVLETLNVWWRTETIPDEATKARVVLIFKKGDKTDLGNYRPISLLNTIYKLFASIIQKCLADKLDMFLQKTQYGFRRKRGTADALHYIRRIVDKGEMTQSKTLLVLLDWEKAFDKVIHEQLLGALERMNVPAKMVTLIREMYRNPQFIVETEGQTSSWKRQETGIRQGCPLSPYLFIIVMTVMFWDIHWEGVKGLERNRVAGTEFDEVLYADDTICISESEQAMNKLLAAIEKQGRRYGMRLNRAKCE